MAQVETWKSRGGPGKSAGMQPVPWPYYMGGASRGMAQFGATLGQAGTNLLEDHIRDRATEELNDLDVNLTKGWSDYQAWVQTHPNEPDIDGAEFKRQSQQWQEQYVSGLETGIARQVGKQKFAKFTAERGAAARQGALQQERTNALASFAASIEDQSTVPDLKQIDPIADLHAREEAIASAFARAADRQLIPSDASFTTEMRKKFRRLWESAVLNAMKHDPDAVETLLSDPENFLEPEDEKRLRGTWKTQQESQRIAADKMQADQIKANDRNLTALTLKTVRGAAEAGQEITPAVIEQAMLRGEISEETGRMMWDRLRRTEEPTPEAQKKAAGVMQRTRDRLLAGEISEDYYDRVYKAYEKDMTVTQAEKWLAVDLDDEYASLRADAFKLATNTIKPLFPDEQTNVEAGPDSPSLKRDGPVGEIMDRMDAWIEEQQKQDKPIDRKAFRERADAIAADVYRETLRKKQGPPERSRWTGKFDGQPIRTATNPKTGERLQWNGEQWVPIQ